MAIVDYGTLKTAFATLSKRGDTVNYVDTLMGLAEKRIATDLLTQTMEVNYELVCNAKWNALPADVIKITKINDEDADVDGKFDSYEIVGTNLKTSPVSSATNVVNVNINYYAEPDTLVNDADSHATLVKHSNVYLAALMLEFAIYKEDDKMIGKRLPYYQDAIEQANTIANEVKYPGGSLQVRNI